MCILKIFCHRFFFFLVLFFQIIIGNQRELLLREEIVAFISHTGASSSNEAVTSGTPVICLPFMGDQVCFFSIAIHLKRISDQIFSLSFATEWFLLEWPSILTNSLLKLIRFAALWQTSPLLHLSTTQNACKNFHNLLEVQRKLLS